MLRSLIFISFFALIACGQTKNRDTVFSSDNCSGSQFFIKNKFIVDWEDGRRTLEEGENKEQFLTDFVEPRINEIKNVEYDQLLKPPVEKNFQASMVPMSPQIDNWGIERTNASSAWLQGHRGQGVIVAIVDTGVDYTHGSLVNQVAYNLNDIPGNGVDDDGNGYVDDYAGYDFFNKGGLQGDNGFHGTHVAGIVAAQHNDNSHQTGYVQGVAPGAQILPVAFMGPNGGSLADAISSIDYAVARGAQVINASWGGAPCSASLGQKIQSLGSKNTLFVVASGNNSVDIDRLKEYPASYNLPSQITVGSIGHFNGQAAHSNYGLLNVHIFSPGVDVYSSVPGNGVAPLTGTSMATPFVAGAAALLWSANPLSTASQIKNAIYSGVTTNNFYQNSTRGRLDIAGALSAL